MKSVIVETRGKYAAALSDDGCVLKVRNHNYAIGQELEMIKKTGIKKKKLAVWAASAAAVLMLCGVSGYAYYTPYSYVSLDVNPSIEFTLNRFDRVLSARGVNDDGQVVLMDVDLTDLSNKSIGDAISKTVYEISKLGYFSGDEDGGIVIATSAKDPDKASELADELQQTVSDQLASEGDQAITEDASGTASGEETSENSSTASPAPSDAPDAAEQNSEDSGNDVIVEVISVGLERVEQARELGVTPGRLHLVEKLQQSTANPEDINIDEWLKKPVKEIMKATKENKKALKAQAAAAGTNSDTAEADDGQIQNDQEQTDAQLQEQADEQTAEQSRDNGSAKDNSNSKNKSGKNDKNVSDAYNGNQAGQVRSEPQEQSDSDSDDDDNKSDSKDYGKNNGQKSGESNDSDSKGRK